MNLKKALVLLLVSCLLFSLVLCLGVAADGDEEETPVETVDTTGEDAEATGETEETAAKKLSVGTIVSLSIGGALILGVIVFCIIKHEKVAAGWRSYRSEMKKITWYPWKQVWRGTVFVIVSVLICAFVIGVLDIAFFEGQYLLTGKGFRFFGGQ